MARSLMLLLMERDKVTAAEANQQIVDAAEECLANGSDPEDVLREEFGVEPDYVFDLVEAMI